LFQQAGWPKLNKLLDSSVLKGGDSRVNLFPLISTIQRLTLSKCFLA